MFVRNRNLDKNNCTQTVMQEITLHFVQLAEHLVTLVLLY